MFSNHSNSSSTTKQQQPASEERHNNKDRTAVISNLFRTKTLSKQSAGSSNGDWFHEERWHSNPFTKDCWHVENICHSSHRWFYDDARSSSSLSSSSSSCGRDYHRQPPFSIDVYAEPKVAGGHPTKLIVAAAAANPPFDEDTTVSWRRHHQKTTDNDNKEEIPKLQCQYSTTPNHLVLQSAYNNMLGEFYARSLVHLYYIHKSVFQQQQQRQQQQQGYVATTLQASDSVEDSFLEQTQLYLHMRGVPRHGELLDSHHLFTDAFRSKPLQSFTSLLDYTGCRCLKRLLLCGYDIVTTTATTSSRTSTTPHDNRQEHRNNFVRTASLTNATSKGHNNVVVNRTELIPKGHAGPDQIIEREYPYAFRELREHLRRKMIIDNPFLQQDITNFRANTIAQHRQTTLTNSTRQQLLLLREFRIVGLTQRTGRRRWLNLDEIIHQCNTEWFNNVDDNIVCVELNIESDHVNPVHQVVMHAACDMIIGIHGAQLTEAIWMDDGSTIVELLPWVHDGARYGAWTRTTHLPTPLGAIFSETLLNHIGYPLDRNSTPYCWNKTDLVDRNKCLNRHSWENRDFQIKPSSVVREMITKFAPLPKRRQSNQDGAVVLSMTTCQEWQQRAGKQTYVLYNIYCANEDDEKTNNSTPSVQHFYWPKPRKGLKRNATMQ